MAEEMDKFIAERMANQLLKSVLEICGTDVRPYQACLKGFIEPEKAAEGILELVLGKGDLSRAMAVCLAEYEFMKKLLVERGEIQDTIPIKKSNGEYLIDFEKIIREYIGRNKNDPF